MEKTILINESYEYNIVDYNKSDAYGEFYVILKSDDFSKVKSDFKTVSSIELKVCGLSIDVYTDYDTFKGIELIPSIYEDNGSLKDGIKVTLSKTDLATQVQRLDSQLNPTIDIESMTLTEYKNCILSNISQQCQSDIYDGLDIEISSGIKHFTYNKEDQMNILQAVTIAINGGGLITKVPYHANGNFCELYPVTDIVTIYSSLQMILTQKTTYCNTLNMYVRSLSTKEEVSKCYYGMDLPPEFQNNMNEVLLESKNIMDTLLSRLSTCIPQ